MPGVHRQIDHHCVLYYKSIGRGNFGSFRQSTVMLVANLGYIVVIMALMTLTSRGKRTHHSAKAGVLPARHAHPSSATIGDSGVGLEEPHMGSHD